MMTTKILWRGRFAGAHCIAERARRVSVVCQGPRYLDCVVEHAEVLSMCQKFAAAAGDLSLADPDEFLRRLEEKEKSEQIKEE